MRYLETIKDQIARSLWSLRNVLHCVPDEHWGTVLGGAPLWQHVYHTIHSLDRWYINPACYSEPPFHRAGLDDLDRAAGTPLPRGEIERYLESLAQKIGRYVDALTEEMLLEKPAQCPYTRFHLIMAQHRHLDMHVGMLMGFIIAETGNWPRVLGVDTDYAQPLSRFF